MKQLLPFLLLLCSLTANAQPFNNRWGIKCSFMGITPQNQITVPMSLEYARYLTDRLSVGAQLYAQAHLFQAAKYDRTGYPSDYYGDCVAQDMAHLSALINYDIRVIRDRVMLRVGGGLGVGFHRIREQDELAKVALHNQLLPVFTLRADWVIRLGKRCELNVSPLILGPDQGFVSLCKMRYPISEFYAHVAFFNLGFSQRF